MAKGKSVAIILTEAERAELEGNERRPSTGQALVERSRIVLLAAGGFNNVQIAEKLSITPPTAGKWRNRFNAHRLDGLADEPRPGAPRTIEDDKVAEIVKKTLETKPDKATHWSTRSMAKAVGHAPSTIGSIWRAFSLQPHRSETFKLSTDPLRRQGARYRRALHASAGEGHGAERR